MKIKLCGIKRKEDIEYINEFRPDYIGFIFAPSARQITPEHAATLNKNLSIGIKSVGIFVNEPVENVVRATEISGTDVIQLHGDEDKEYIDNLKKHTDKKILKAVRLQNSDDLYSADRLGADFLLIDSFKASQYGGTGKTADWNVIKHTIIYTPFFLAGGINTENITEAISCVDPYGIDISGGIETNGLKDREKIRKIMNIVNPYRFDS